MFASTLPSPTHNRNALGNGQFDEKCSKNKIFTIIIEVEKSPCRATNGNASHWAAKRNLNSFFCTHLIFASFECNYKFCVFIQQLCRLHRSNNKYAKAFFQA